MLTVFTPPAPLRRAMIRSTFRAWEATPDGDPVRAILALQLESLRRDCPHENRVVMFRARAVLCQDCFSGFPIRLEEEDGSQGPHRS